jgi:soluble lytic murein transglycosylase-like protein
MASHAGYGGLFQFGSITWKNIRKEIGEDPNPDLRFNAEEAVQTAAYAISKGKKSSFWPNCYP